MRCLNAAAAAAVATLALAACSSFEPRIGLNDPDVGIPGSGPATGPDTGIPAPGVDTGPNMGVRQVCRSEPKRHGWIAVEYVPVGAECPRTPGDGGYNGAVLENYLRRPVGSTMVVCADQRTPHGWRRELTISERECPGARVGKAARTTRVIRRVR